MMNFVKSLKRDYFNPLIRLFSVDPNFILQSLADDLEPVSGDAKATERSLRRNKRQLYFAVDECPFIKPESVIKIATRISSAVVKCQRPYEGARPSSAILKDVHGMLEVLICETLKRIPAEDRVSLIPNLVQASLNPYDFLCRNMASITECLSLKKTSGLDNPKPLNPKIFLLGDADKSSENILLFIRVIQSNLKEGSLLQLRSAGYEAFVGYVCSKNILVGVTETQEDQHAEMFESSRRQFVLGLAQDAFETAATQDKKGNKSRFCLNIEPTSLFNRASELVLKPDDPIQVAESEIFNLMKVKKDSQITYVLAAKDPAVAKIIFPTPHFLAVCSSCSLGEMRKRVISLDLRDEVKYLRINTLGEFDKLVGELNAQCSPVL